jgi:hypothetical protein
LNKDLTWVYGIAFMLCSSCLERWRANPDPDRLRKLIRERHGIKEEN